MRRIVRNIETIHISSSNRIISTEKNKKEKGKKYMNVDKYYMLMKSLVSSPWILSPPLRLRLCLSTNPTTRDPSKKAARMGSGPFMIVTLCSSLEHGKFGYYSINRVKSLVFYRFGVFDWVLMGASSRLLPGSPELGLQGTAADMRYARLSAIS